MNVSMMRIHLYIIGLVAAIAFGFGCAEQSVIDLELTIPSPRILVQDAWQNIQPSWHPDGARVVFVAQSATGKPRGSWLRTVEINDRKVTTLFQDTTFAYFPKYSGDGKELVFVSGRSGSFDVWIQHLTDGSTVHLSHEPGSETFPCWSPDDGTIAYITQGRIAFTDRNGANVSYAANLPSSAWSLCWGEDAGTVIFSCFRDGFEQIYSYDRQEQQVRELSEEPLEGNWPAAPRKSQQAIGAYFVFQSGGGILLYKFTSQSVTEVVASGLMPAWSPDGLDLVYTSGGKLVQETLLVMMDE
jgi:Tol biopolymer transport system component